jgi:hypothetical protein
MLFKKGNQTFDIYFDFSGTVFAVPVDIASVFAFAQCPADDSFRTINYTGFCRVPVCSTYIRLHDLVGQRVVNLLTLCLYK